MGGRGGLGCLSFFRGSAGGIERCGGTVGRGLVGGGILSGGPLKIKQQDVIYMPTSGTQRRKIQQKPAVRSANPTVEGEWKK